jgi:hypothetical protein
MTEPEIDELKITEGNCALFECEAYNVVTGFTEADILFYMKHAKEGKYKNLITESNTIIEYLNSINTTDSIDGFLNQKNIKKDEETNAIIAAFTATKKAYKYQERDVIQSRIKGNSGIQMENARNAAFNAGEAGKAQNIATQLIATNIQKLTSIEFKAITKPDLETPGQNHSKNNFIITFNELLEDLNIPLIPIPDFDMFIRVIYAGMYPTKMSDENSFQVFIDDRTNVQPVKKRLNIVRKSPQLPLTKQNILFEPMSIMAAPAAGGGRKKKSKNKSKYKNNIRKKTKNNIKKKFRSNTKKRKSLKNKNTLKASRNSSKRKRKHKTYQNLKGGGNGFLSMFKGCMPKPDLVSFPLTREEEEEEEQVVKDAAQAIKELRLPIGEVSEEKISALKIKVEQIKIELRLPIGEVTSALEKKVESEKYRKRGETGVTGKVVTEKEEEFDGLEAAPTSLPRKLFFSEDNKKLDIEDMSDARSEDKKNNERRLFKLYYMLESIAIPLFFKVAPLQEKCNARIAKLGKHNLHFCRTPNNTLGQYIYESTIYDILNYKLSNLPDKSLSKKVLDIYGYGILTKDNLDFHIAKETDNKRQAHKVSSLHTDAQKLILPETIKERINIILNSFDDSDPYNYVSYQIVECDDHYITFKSLLGNTSFTEENAKLFLVSVAQTSVELYEKCGFVHFDLHGANYLINKTELSGSIPKCKFFDFDLSMIKLPENLFDKEKYYSHSQTAAYDAIRMLDLTGSNDQNKEDTVFLKIGHIFDICRLCSDNIIVGNQGSVWYLARSSLEWIIRVNYNKLSTLHEILIGNIRLNRGKRGGIIDLQTYIHSNTYYNSDTKCIFTKEEYKTLVSIFTGNEANYVHALNISNFKIFYKNKFIQCVIIALWCYLFNSEGEEAFF